MRILQNDRISVRLKNLKSMKDFIGEDRENYMRRKSKVVIFVCAANPKGERSIGTPRVRVLDSTPLWLRVAGIEGTSLLMWGCHWVSTDAAFNN